MEKGYLISLEGGEGSGKSTQIKLLKNELENLGQEVVVTREPGGTKIGKEIRKILLDSSHNNMDSKAEALLYAADRAQDIKENIKPALEKGQIVLADRYVDSSIIYQGHGRELDVKKVKEINKWVLGEFWPDLTIILDIAIEKGLARAREISLESDRLEEEVTEFHQKIKKGFLSLAETESRCEIVDADESIPEVHSRIINIIKERLL